MEPLGVVGTLARLVGLTHALPWLVSNREKRKSRKENGKIVGVKVECDSFAASEVELE